MGRPSHCEVKVSIVKDNAWTLSAEFECDVLEIGMCRSLLDHPSDDRGPHKRNLVDIHMARDRGADGSPIADDYVYDTRWESCLSNKGRSAERAERRKLRGFENDGAPGGEGRAELPGHHPDLHGEAG